MTVRHESKMTAGEALCGSSLMVAIDVSETEVSMTRIFRSVACRWAANCLTLTLCRAFFPV